MDLLYTRKFDGFCLVTSDSDFTGLAMRLREEALTVLGFGEQKTPEAFKNACHKFIFTEVLRPSVQAETTVSSTEIENQQKVSASPVTNDLPKSQPIFPKEFVLDALDKSSDDSGWAHLGTFGSYLNKLKPDFDARTYGYKKLSDLVKAMPDIFVTEERCVDGSDYKNLYVRAKR